MREVHRNVVSLLLEAQALLDAGDLDGADAGYQQALGIEPELVTALHGRALVAVQRCDAGAALAFVQTSLGHASAQASSLSPAPVRALQLGSIHPGGHTNTGSLLHETWSQTTTVLVEKWNLNDPLPPHDIIVNAIADGYAFGPALDLAEHLISKSNRPVINRPERIRATTASGNARHLRGIEGLRIPSVLQLTRGVTKAYLAFPILMRVPGHHNGKHFELLTTVEERDRALSAFPEGDILAIEYVDARGKDGAFRKYRALAIDGKLYPAHLAIGDQWKLHYFSATMNDERRAEEAAFLANMEWHIGERACRALCEVVRRIELDYFGIDFGIDRSGNVILFEANAAMTVFLPENEPQNAERRSAVFLIDSALYTLVERLVGPRSSV